MRIPFAALLLAALAMAACSLQPGQPYQAASVTLSPQAASGDILSLRLTVIGPDMSPLTFIAEPVGESLTIKAPAGKDRMFVLQIVTASGRYIGTATADLLPGAVIPLAIELFTIGASVIICHDNDTTIIVTSSGSLDVHLIHGDSIGSCP